MGDFTSDYSDASTPIMSIIYINHAVSMLDALIVNTLSSNQLSLSYDYNSIINFHSIWHLLSTYSLCEIVLLF